MNISDINLDKYEILKNGKIWSVSKQKFLKGKKDRDGYTLFELSSKDGKFHTYKLHRIIAETFLPNPENKPCINHKIEGDEGKTINMVFFNEDGSINREKSTIEWVTYKENNNYGTHYERIFEKTTNGKLSKKVLQFTLDGEFVREWPSVMETGRNGYNSAHVADCCRGERKSHKGFKWCYA